VTQIFPDFANPEGKRVSVKVNGSIYILLLCHPEQSAIKSKTIYAKLIPIRNPLLRVKYGLAAHFSLRMKQKSLS
jgi:hypothetical protein